MKRSEVKNHKKTYGWAMLPRPQALVSILLFEIKQLKIRLFYMSLV